MRVDYIGSGEILITESRLTRYWFRQIFNNCMYEAMNNGEHDEVAVIISGNAKYYICCDTWQEFARVYGEMNVFKDSLETAPIYTKHYILAD